jgi:hypothetical protein
MKIKSVGKFRKISKRGRVWEHKDLFGTAIEYKGKYYPLVKETKNDYVVQKLSKSERSGFG